MDADNRKHIALIPSLARGTADFDELVRSLTQRGYHCVGFNPRGVEGAPARTPYADLLEWADEIADELRKMRLEHVTVIGHALGGRVARCLASRHPDLVDRLILLAAGGSVEVAKEIYDAAFMAIEHDLPDAEWCRLMHKSGFFSPVNDPMVWRSGWWRNVSRDQKTAYENTDIASFEAGGQAPMLIIQGLDDVGAPPENGYRLAARFPDRVTLCDVPGAGHAMLPEQPDLILNAILKWLDGNTADRQG